MDIKSLREEWISRISELRIEYRYFIQKILNRWILHRIGKVKEVEICDIIGSLTRILSKHNIRIKPDDLKLIAIAYRYASIQQEVIIVTENRRDLISNRNLLETLGSFRIKTISEVLNEL